MNKYLPLIALSSSLALSQTAFAKSSSQFFVGAHGGQTVSSRLTNVSAAYGTTFNDDIKSFHSYPYGARIGYRMENLSFDIDFTYLPIPDGKDGFGAEYKDASYETWGKSRFEAAFFNVAYEASWLHPTYHPFVSIGVGNLHATINTKPASVSKDLFKSSSTRTGSSDNHFGLQTKLGVSTNITDSFGIGVNITSLIGFGKYQVTYHEENPFNWARASGNYYSHSLIGQIVYTF